MIKRLNPIIRGWAAYYRTQVSSDTFRRLDHYLWKLTHKWATFSHANKPSSWVFARYFGKFNKDQQDRWVLGDRASGAYLHRLAWTSIVRHQIVTGESSPDDRALAEYWKWRRPKAPMPTSKTSRWLHKDQDDRCAICKGTLNAAEDRPQTPEQWEHWLASPRTTIVKIVTQHATTDPAEPRLIHAHCHHGSGLAILPAYKPPGLARAGCDETRTPGS